MSRLLILSCSDKKRAASGKMPAVDLYDGPAYRVLRAYRERVPTMGDAGLSVMILSAEHGLIGGWDSIATYDREMTSDRAAELVRSKTFRKAVGDAFQAKRPAFFFGGAVYRNCLLAGLVKVFGQENGPTFERRLSFAEGRGIGDMLGQLKEWLDAGTLTHAQRADAIAVEIDALERRYDGPMPAEARQRMAWLEDELREAAHLARTTA